jgi:hypothetical protein
MDRDPGSDLPENLGLLEYGCIETSRPKRERSGQTSDTAADNYDVKRTRHYSQTLAVNRNHGPGDVAERFAAYSREHLADAPRATGQAGDGMPAHDSMPAKYVDGRTQHDATCGRRLPPPGALVSALRLFERKHRAQSRGISACL